MTFILDAFRNCCSCRYRYIRDVEDHFVAVANTNAQERRRDWVARRDPGVFETFVERTYTNYPANLPPNFEYVTGQDFKYRNRGFQRYSKEPAGWHRFFGWRKESNVREFVAAKEKATDKDVFTFEVALWQDQRHVPMTYVHARGGVPHLQAPMRFSREVVTVPVSIYSIMKRIFGCS